MSKLRLSKKTLTGSKLLGLRLAISSSFFLIAATVLYIIHLISPALFAPIKTAAIASAAPVIGAINQPLQHVKATVQDVKSYWNLRSTNARLREDNEKLTAWYLQAKSLRAENEALRALNRLTNLTPPEARIDNALTSVILSDTSTEFSRSLLIKAGAKEGVHKNAIVLSSRGLVGRITEVADHTARALLITDINTRVPVIISHGDLMIHAVMAGQNQNTPLLSHIADQNHIETLRRLGGAHIMTSGTGDLFPYGLPIGTLKVTTDGRLHVAPYMNTREFLFVKIITDDKADSPSSASQTSRAAS